MKLLTFHNDVKIKEKYLARLKEHHRLDEIVQRIGFEKNGKTRGCAVGCTLDKYDHQAYETELGIPEWLARLEDTIFEGLPMEKASIFAVNFLESIPVGIDLSSVKYSFCAFLMRENMELVSKLELDEKLKKKVLEAIHGVLQLHEVYLRTGKWDEKAAEKATRAAEASWAARKVAGKAQVAAKAAGAAQVAAEAAWAAAEAAEAARKVEGTAQVAAGAAGAARAAWAAWATRAAGAAQAAAEAAWATRATGTSRAARATGTARAARAAGAALVVAKEAKVVGAAAWAEEKAAYILFAKELIRLIKQEK